MSQQTKTVTWTKPELTRLGKLADVAGGNQTPGTQGGGTKS